MGSAEERPPINKGCLLKFSVLKRKRTKMNYCKEVFKGNEVISRIVRMIIKKVFVFQFLCAMPRGINFLGLIQIIASVHKKYDFLIQRRREFRG